LHGIDVILVKILSIKNRS